MTQRRADRQGDDEFRRRREDTLLEARARGALWSFGSIAEQVGYPMPHGIECAYLDFLAKAADGTPEVSDDFKNLFYGGKLRFRVHGGIAALFVGGGLRTFIPAIRKRHEECGRPDGKEDRQRHTRFGYVEGSGEFFQEMRQKRRIVDFCL